MDDLIWKYLEGKCNKSDFAKVELKKLQDPVFAEKFESYRIIHDSLQKNVINKAPLNLEFHVLNRLKKSNNFNYHGISRTPIFLFIAASIALILLSLFINVPSSEPYSLLLEDHLSFSIPIPELSLPGPHASYLYLISVFLAIPLFYWIDKIIQRGKLNTLQIF